MCEASQAYASHTQRILRRASGNVSSSKPDVGLRGTHAIISCTAMPGRHFIAGR